MNGDRERDAWNYYERCPTYNRPARSSRNLRRLKLLILGGSSMLGLVGVAALPLAGFGLGGIAAGSFAASWQAAIGSVAAGSLFATLQSLGASGIGILLFGSTGAALGLLGTVANTLGWCVCVLDQQNQNLLPHRFIRVNNARNNANQNNANQVNNPIVEANERRVEQELNQNLLHHRFIRVNNARNNANQNNVNQVNNPIAEANEERVEQELNQNLLPHRFIRVNNARNNGNQNNVNQVNNPIAEANEGRVEQELNQQDIQNESFENSLNECPDCNQPMICVSNLNKVRKMITEIGLATESPWNVLESLEADQRDIFLSGDDLTSAMHILAKLANNSQWNWCMRSPIMEALTVGNNANETINISISEENYKDCKRKDIA